MPLGSQSHVSAPAVGVADRTPAESHSVIVGISGVRQNAAAAAVVGGRLTAFCEQERLTRIRSVGLEAGRLPEAAVGAVLGAAMRWDADVSMFATAEPGAVLPARLPAAAVDHHRAHAATAALTSPFASAVVLVCDEHSDPPVTVWLLKDGQLTRQPWPWAGPGFASLYSECTELFGFASRSEFQVEALARLAAGDRAEELSRRIAYRDGALHVDRSWKTAIFEWLTACGGVRNTRGAAIVASSFQQCLGDALIALLGKIRTALPVANLCLGGGLFYNTYFNTRVVEAGLFERVFVPANPGNPGLAAGAALSVAADTTGVTTGSADPFLGPEFQSEAIKATLDNCKLTYEYLSERQVVDATVAALLRGQLVGWFHGAMESGPRSLGNRSILANPFAPHVLENLNAFLKQREPHRAYGLSVRVEDAPQHFRSTAPSAFMELEYALLDPPRFRHVLPGGVRTLRVQTVGERPPLFREVHRTFAEATGAGVLVNTSFNGFHEPIVCSPRDAVRVFYGGGLDMVVLGRFVLHK